ncbi:MAG: ATP-binding protein [Kofleriaceae bacterium]
MRPAERYRLIERLGEGSIGIVHRALDLATNREVALKIMPRARGSTNLRGEFVALARLRHPNVVSVLDYGLTDAGDEYFTMELITGPSLTAAAGPVTALRLWALLGGVLDALAAVHGAGMVHADLKPSNILVDGAALVATPGRAGRLADFGLVTPLVDPGGPTARGTIGYAAPEAWSGRLDPRSDLYSFGVVLWQLVLGERPFTGATPRAVVTAQRVGAPGDPRRRRPELPAPLVELMVALLDPAPSARPQSAEEVLERWRRIADGLGYRDVATSRGTAVRARHRAIALPAQVGRSRELAELERAWTDARDGRGAPIVITGEAGIGKSRLLAEVALHVQLDGGEVVRLSAVPGDAPWSPLRNLARALVAVTGPAWARAGSGAGPHVAALLDDHAPLALGRWVLAEALVELVAAAAEVRPLAILVDDAERAPPTVHDALAYLARAAPDLAALVVVAGRLQEPRAGDGPTTIEAAAAAATRGRRFELVPLGQGSFGHLVAAAVGADVAARIADELRRVSGGNPGHAIATLEAMIDSGAISRLGGAWTTARELVVPLLPAARQSALGRLSTLSTAARGFLRAAAVLSDPFDRELLATILGIAAPPVAAVDGVPEPLPEGIISVSTRIPVAEAIVLDDDASRRVAIDSTIDELDLALADAVAARALTADPAAGQFRFAHKELADILGRELTPAARLEYHRRAALGLEDRLAAGQAVSAAAMARHHRALGDGRLAARWCLAAAADAVRSGDLPAAVAHATDALALADPDDQRPLLLRVAELAGQAGELDLALHHFRLAADGAALDDGVTIALEIADLERRRGHPDAALAAATGALATARRGGDATSEGRCHLRIAWLFVHRADYGVAAEHANLGLALARRSDDRALTIELVRVAAAIATSVGDPRRALALLDTMPPLGDGDGDARLAAGVAHELGRAAIQAGDYPRAIAALERAVAAAEAAGDLEQRARSLNNLGAACYYQGDWGQARRLWERFRQQSERQGDRLETIHALNNLGSLYRDLGMLADARAAFERAAVLAERTGAAHLAAMVMANRGEVDARAGDLGAARERYERALAECVRLGAREDAIETRRRLSELDLVVGRTDEALARALEAARDAKDLGARFEEGVLHRVAAAALRGQGDLDSARWFVDRARELLAGLGARYELARVAVEAAELAHAGGDDEVALVQIAAAEAELATLGARWDLERARALRRTLGPRPASAPPLPQAIAAAQAAVRGDTDEAIALALAAVLTASGCDRGFVLILDGHGRPQIRARHLGGNARGFDRGDADVSGTIVRKVAATGHAVAVADAVLDADLREQSSVVALGLRRVWAAPLRARGRLIGIVYVDSSSCDLDERPLDPDLLDAALAPLTLALDHARLQAEARRSAELMSILAHEIRNPLAGILGYSEMGREPDLAPAHLDHATLFERIHGDAERLRRLVDNVFELSRHEAGRLDASFAAIDVERVVRTVADDFARAMADRRLALAIEVAAPVGPALGNADRLAQVVSNLLGNAVKFSPVGGTITIAVRRERVAVGDRAAPPLSPTDPRAWIPLAPGDDLGDVIRLDVRDHGPGMSEDLRAQLFEKFTQGAGAAKHGGLGLGLYLCREIIRQHGGAIWVDSELGQGACFSVRLPVAL